MNLQETAYWLDGLFPGDLKFSRINGLHIASIDLSSEDTTEALACTADFGRVDTGLVSSEEAFEDRGVEKQVEVRSEIFCVASAEPEVVEQHHSDWYCACSAGPIAACGGGIWWAGGDAGD